MRKVMRVQCQPLNKLLRGSKNFRIHPARIIKVKRSVPTNQETKPESDGSKGKFILNQTIEGPSPAKAMQPDSAEKPKSLFGSLGEAPKTGSLFGGPPAGGTLFGGNFSFNSTSGATTSTT